MEKQYRGVVIEEALDDNSLLNQLLVEKIHITKHEKRQDRWHMYQVLVSREQIDELAKHIINDWYIHFWREAEIIALFSNNKQFEFNYYEKETWKDVLEYGRSIGIPEKELDFLINGL